MGFSSSPRSIPEPGCRLRGDAAAVEDGFGNGRGKNVRSNERQVLLRARPNGIPQAEHFEVADAPMLEISDRQFLVRNKLLSVEPANARPVSVVANYSKPVGIGEVM
jgi:N-terminal domain of oxidoreductase